MNFTVTIGKTAIRPTAYGWTLVFLLVWIPVAGVAAANNFLLLVFFLTIGLTIISHWLAVRNINSVSVSRRFPEEVYAETAFSMKYLLRSNWEAWGATAITFNEDPRLIGHDGDVYCSKAPGDQPTVVRGSFSVSHRGDITVGQGTLRSAFPFGLAEYSQEKGASNSFLVYPKIQPVDEEIPNRLGDPGKGLERVDPFGTIPFRFRRYVPGDPFRSIEWKKTARTGTLITKVLSEEGAKSLTIRLPSDASEEAISKAASLVVHFVLMETPVCLEGPGIRIGPGRGDEFRRNVLALLARWEDSIHSASDDTTQQEMDAVIAHVEQSGSISWDGSGASL